MQTTRQNYPRITYHYAANRMFERLFKESTLEGMKDVVRKKLCIATSVPIYFSQIRDSTQVDLEDDDDFAAFSSFMHENWAARVNVFVGSGVGSSVVSSPVSQYHHPSKKRRLDPRPPGISGRERRKWDLLWETFWGKPATECFIKASTHIPDLRTLELARDETKYEYLKLPDDDTSFPCGLRRMLIIDHHRTLYTMLCEEDRLYTELEPSERLESLTHSTIVAGQPGTGKTVGLSCILVWRLQEKKPTVYCANFLLRTPDACGWGGKLFEQGVHRAFRKGIKFTAQPLDDDAAPLIVKIANAKSESSGYFHTLSVRAKPGSRKVGDKFLNRYLVPLSSTQETIDGAYISEDVTVLFQMTVSPSHDLNLRGITELTDEPPAGAKKRICIVFFIPEHATTVKKFRRQCIVCPVGEDSDVVETVVD